VALKSRLSTLIGVAVLSGCGSSTSHPSAKAPSGRLVLHFLPFRGKVTTPGGSPVADAAIVETLLRPFMATCARTLVGYRSSADGTFADENVMCSGSGVVRVSAYKPGYVVRPVVLTLRRAGRVPYVHLIAERR
jgi:hypothetical protein